MSSISLRPVFDPEVFPIRACLRPEEELISNCGPIVRKVVSFDSCVTVLTIEDDKVNPLPQFVAIKTSSPGPNSGHNAKLRCDDIPEAGMLFLYTQFGEAKFIQSQHVKKNEQTAKSIRIKTLACDYCEAKFSGIQPLKIHKLKHAGEWPPNPPPPPPNDYIPDFHNSYPIRPFIANLVGMGNR